MLFFLLVFVFANTFIYGDSHGRLESKRDAQIKWYPFRFFTSHPLRKTFMKPTILLTILFLTLCYGNDNQSFYNPPYLGQTFLSDGKPLNGTAVSNVVKCYAYLESNSYITNLTINFN